MKKKDAYSSENIAREIKVISKEKGVDPIDVYYEILLESDFKPYALSMYTREKISALRKRFHGGSVPVIKKSNIHKDLIIFHFLSKKNAYAFIDTLKYDTPYSVGLMGVPSKEYSFWEKDKYFDSRDNIERGIGRMMRCSHSFRKTRDQIECLNKLSNKDYIKYNYWRKYKRLRGN